MRGEATNRNNQLDGAIWILTSRFRNHHHILDGEPDPSLIFNHRRPVRFVYLEPELRYSLLDVDSSRLVELVVERVPGGSDAADETANVVCGPADLKGAICAGAGRVIAVDPVDDNLALFILGHTPELSMITTVVSDDEK